MPSFDVRRGRRSSPTSQPTFYSVFNTNKKIYIDVGEFSSRNATTQYEINTYYNLVQTDDVLSFDVLTTGTGVKYLCISLEFSK
jgi:archaellum component FlaF (FlaF/FlaG flagellin family)